MAKQLNVNLAFTADTGAVRQQLQSLQTQLSQLANTPVTLKGSITQEIINASNAAAELKIHLEQATNTKTGNLDFSKLNQSIKNSGSSLAEYGEKLKSLGPAGNTAFQALAQSVAKAEIPIRRSNAALANMWTTLKNSARWQISSSMLHGFIGAVQSALGYAQDLNESLNNIRIVTGQNVDQMARFAEQANKAAKALSTTTTEYTNASLIYYQQGLSDSEVAARTEVTIKMANAAGQSAQTVSDQLTAVWNNFAKGGENLEYYADVMTALGAATASSTDEISEGLNKFASVAETVGLSYEYAASALATVTATTRQSADVVGTAFKTLFARIQDLELGKTLDDGTTLGTYSQALQKIGVDIKDANGEMKNMDTILSEMAAKWTILNKDQQVALAKSVAGVRQYTQLIALMENWDFMEQNLETSYEATGTLDEQAEIYAESWEAAQKRVSAAVESIYSDLLNDEFFIDVLNGFEKFLTLVDKVIDSMGGLRGVLAGVSALMLKVFSSQISQSLTNMAYSIQMMTKSGRQKIQDEQTSFVANAAASLNPTDENATVESQTREASLRNQLQLQVGMMTNAEKMSTQEMEVNQMLLDRVRLIGEEVALKAKAVDLAKEEVASASIEARADAMYAEQLEAGYENRNQARKKGSAKYTEASSVAKAQVGAEAEILSIIEQIKTAGSASTEQIMALESAVEKMDAASNGAFKELVQDELDAVKHGESVEMGLREIAEAAKIVVEASGKQGLLNAGVKEENADRVIAGYRQEAKVVKENNDALEQESKLVSDLSSRIKNVQGTQKNWADTVVASARSISSLSMGISSLGSVVDTIQNPDISGWEKFTSILMSLSMGIPMLISGLTGLNTTLGFTSAAQALATLRSQDYINAHKTSIATLTEETLAEHAAALAKEAHISKKQAEAILIRASTAAKLEELAATRANITAMTAEQLAEKTGMTTDQASIIISKMKAGATLEEAMTEAGLTSTKMGGVAASVASFVAKQAETGATWAQVVAHIALKTAMAPLLVITLLLAAAMATVASIIWIVVNAVQSITAAYNADTIAAENATDAAKNLAAAYKEVKAEYDDMISAMDNYQTARDGLDSLTEGTLKYQEALQKANEYALELIEAGNLVKGQDYTIKNGEIIISDEAMQSAKEKKFNEVQDAYAASTMANAKSAQAQVKSNQIDLIRKNDGSAVGNTTAAGAAAGAAIGSFIPGIGTAIGALGGAVIGAIGGAIYNGVDNSIENGKIDELTTLYDQIGEAAFDSATLQELGFDTANQAYIDSVKDVVRETNAAAEQMEVAAELAASAVLEKNEAYQNSEYQDKISGAAGKGYQAEYKKAYEEAMKQTKNNDWFGIGSKENKATMEEYAEQMGLNDLNSFKVTNYKKGGNVEYEYIDENGYKQTVELTQQQIAAQLAATEASEHLAEQTQTLLNTFNRLEDSTNKADQALADFASGDLFGASKSEFEDMESELADYITADENGNRTLSYQGALDYINANFSAEELQAMGYANAEEAAAAFKQQFDANLKAWDSIELPENLIETGDMSLKTAQNFQNALNDINLGPVGEQAGKDFFDGINKMVEGLDTEDQQAALEELSKIDWSDWDALEQADTIMKEYGVDIDTTSKEWVEYANKMRQAAGATPDFSKLKDTLTSITAILQDLDFGSVISDEDYQKLVQYNDEWERYFMLQADGSRVFIGDSQAMQQEVRNNIIEQRKAALREMYQRTDAVTEEELSEMNDQFDEMMASTATNVADLNSLYEQGEISAEAWGKQAEVLKQNMLGNASTLGELRAAMSELEQNNVDVSQTEKSNALMELASSYDNCTKEIEEYKTALAGADEAQIASAEDALNAAILIGEASSKYGLDSEALETQARQIKKLNPELNLSAEQAARLAVNNQRMNKGVKALNENFKDWKKTLTSADKASMDYAEALTNVENVIGDLIGAAEDFTLPDGFIDLPGVMDLIQKAATGDELAINQLGNKISAASVKAMTMNESLVNMYNEAFGANITTDTFEAAKQTVLDGINSIYNNLNGLLDGSTNITDVLGNDWVTALNEMALATGMSVDQMNGLLSQLGVQAEVKTVNVPQEVEVPTYDETYVSAGTKTFTYTEIGEDGEQITHLIERPVMRKISVPGPLVKTQGYVQVASIGTVEGGGADTPQLSYTGVGGTANNSNGGNVGGGVSPSSTGGSKSGGGSTKKTSNERGKKTDMVDRYKEVDDTLDDVRRQMDKASKAADRLWGPARINAMKKVNGILENEIDLLKSKKEEADAYLDEDRDDLDSAVSNLGLSFEYDSDGNIKNYETQMTSLYEAREALLDSFGSEMDENEQKTLSEFDDKVDALKDAISQYDETRELSQDLAEEIQDKIYEWQDNNYEQLNYKLELEIEINDSELELLEYYMGKTEGNIYKTAEAFGYLAGQTDIYTNNLKQQEEYVNELNRAYQAGEISIDAYKEGLREAQSATIENLQALEEQKKAMQEYYGEVMDMALEEISIYTDEMEQLNSVLDHYSNILELVGKQEDYTTKGKILQSKATNLRNELQVQQELYEKSNAEAEKWAAKMATVIEGSNEYETYKKNWIAAQQAANEAQDAMLNKTEEWAESMKAIVENELAGLAKTMEESLTGGTSFDELLTSMERRSSLQEEYLTTTNQIYETNKLMRQVQQEIDKTTNSVAKRKLANFINETEQMQNQTELSQYELDIQQAKYDLLLAEIALEEAQSAKSTVRLQRDSEGNFGYIYTADQGAVSEAEQNLADKQNALYNLGLEGANDYNQKYAETMQEAQDAITELTEMWMNGEIESEEEYQRRKAEIQDYYYEKLKQYSSLYQVALTTDSNVIKDAWSTDFSDMIYKTEDWKIATDDYFAGAAESMKTWAEICGTVLEESGLDDVSKKVEEINTKSENLKNTLIGEDGESGVVGAMMSEVEAAGKLSEAYIGIQNQIDEVIKKYEKMMDVINEDYTNENTPKIEPAIAPEPEPAPESEPPKTEESVTPELNVGSTVTVKKNASRWVSGERIWNPVKGNNFKVKQINGEKILIGDPFGPNYSASGITGWIKKTDLEGFATGGYTGEWEGSYGKLAMLHQKELVLNAGDTENFLAGMDLLDKIVSAIDLYSMNSQLGGALSSPSLGNMGGGDMLEQQVHIEANFPSVQDRNEIEEAFNTLINRASQYANRK